jgi:2-keto-4-pentenoate hydratase/2-oxohepta-3-ene-1,7-dioic acid hydratase in catechol pathway
MKNALSRLGRPIPAEWYEVPAYYKGVPDTVIGPDDTIPWPAWTEHLDRELELAAVIGLEPVRDVSAVEAAGAVFGWDTIGRRGD